MNPCYSKTYRRWTCKYQKRNVFLCGGEGDEATRQKAYEIMQTKCPVTLWNISNGRGTVPQFASYHHERVKANYRANGWREHYRVTKAFAERWHDLAVAQLIPLHLQTFLEEKQYGNNRWNFCIAAICAMFNWGVGQGVLSKNPVKGVKPKPKVTKTLEHVITDAEHDTLMASTNPEGRRILTALWETGCRPCELRQVRATWYNADIRAWVFPDGEAKTTNRKVYLSHTMIEMTEKLIARGRDYLFRSPSTKKRWNDESGIYFSIWFRKVKLKAGLDRDELTAYSYRHRFCTNLILKDVHLSKIAELMGHTSIKTLQKWYAHLKGNHTVLTDVLDSIS